MLRKIPVMVIPFLCFYPIYKIGAIGAGDVKLYCLLGCYLSLKNVFWIIFLSLCIAAFLSLIKMCYLKIFFSRMQYFLEYSFRCISNQTMYPYYSELNKTEQSTITLALPIFIGSIIIIGRKLYESYYGSL